MAGPEAGKKITPNDIASLAKHFSRDLAVEIGHGCGSPMPQYTKDGTGIILGLVTTVTAEPNRPLECCGVRACEFGDIVVTSTFNPKNRYHTAWATLYPNGIPPHAKEQIIEIKERLGGVFSVVGMERLMSFRPFAEKYLTGLSKKVVPQSTYEVCMFSRKAGEIILGFVSCKPKYFNVLSNAADHCGEQSSEHGKIITTMFTYKEKKEYQYHCIKAVLYPNAPKS